MNTLKDIPLEMHFWASAYARIRMVGFLVHRNTLGCDGYGDYDILNRNFKSIVVWKRRRAHGVRGVLDIWRDRFGSRTHCDPNLHYYIHVHSN